MKKDNILKGQAWADWGEGGQQGPSVVPGVSWHLSHFCGQTAAPQGGVPGFSGAVACMHLSDNMSLRALSREFPVGWVTGLTASSAALCTALHPEPSKPGAHGREMGTSWEGTCVGGPVCGNVCSGAATLKGCWFQQEVERAWPA